MIYRDIITLTYAPVTTSDLGVPVMGTPAIVGEVWASVRRMSANKTMMTFQQADIIGIDIEFRNTGLTYNGITWEGSNIHYSAPEDVDGRGRIVRLQGYYQIDNPAITPVSA